MKLRSSDFFRLILFILFINTSKAQTNPIYIEPEFMIGQIVPDKDSFPSTKTLKSYVINIGIINNSTAKNWNNYYNHPSVGVSLAYTDLDNPSYLGHELSAVSYILFKSSRHKFNCSYFKVGMGAAYFSDHYNVITDPKNIYIGAPFTWSFQAFLYRYIYNNDWLHLKLGAGYLHNSDGHIQLPNFGLNSAALTLSAQFFTTKVDYKTIYPDERPELDHSLQYFFNVRDGNGLQEFGGKDGPSGSSKKGVYSLALSGGVIVNEQLKLRAGLTYRYYQHYYEYITQTPYQPMINSPVWNSSNIYVSVGCEFLVGHFGLDAEEGINLFKPFYPKFYQLFERGPDIDLTSKKLIATRFGLNYYLINTSKKPRNNIYIGANIAANFGQADFSELSIGFTHCFR